MTTALTPHQQAALSFYLREFDATRSFDEILDALLDGNESVSVFDFRDDEPEPNEYVAWIRSHESYLRGLFPYPSNFEAELLPLLKRVSEGKPMDEDSLALARKLHDTVENNMRNAEINDGFAP